MLQPGVKIRAGRVAPGVGGSAERPQKPGGDLKAAAGTADERGGPLALDFLLAHVIEIGGSDLHLKVDSAPMARVDGTLTPIIGEPPLTDEVLERFLMEVSERTRPSGSTSTSPVTSTLPTSRRTWGASG